MISVTKHAYKRAKERLGWNRSAVNKMVLRVYDHGIRIADTSGPFRRYLDYIMHHGGCANTLRVYGHHIFLFCTDCLITIFDLPHKYINQVKGK